MARPKWPFAFVEVVWEDTRSDSRWRDIEELPDVVTVHSRGWLIHKSRRSVTICASIYGPVEDGDNHTVGDVTTIPRKCVLEIKPI